MQRHAVPLQMTWDMTLEELAEKQYKEIRLANLNRRHIREINNLRVGSGGSRLVN